MFKNLNLKFKEKINKTLLFISFICFISILIWIVIFKANYFNLINDIIKSGLNDTYKERLSYFWTINLNESKYILEFFLNILIFLPFGIYLPLLLNNHKVLLTIIISFISSLSFELIQFLTALGSMQLMDLITNLLGSIIGILIYFLLIQKCSSNIINYINLAICIISIPIIIFAITNTAIHFNYYLPFFK